MPLNKVHRIKVSVEMEYAGVSCNACGKEAEMPDMGFPDGFHVIRLQGGYGDQFPGDMEVIEWVACEECLQKWTDSFKFPNVSLGGGFSPKPLIAKHSETLEELIYEGGWLRPKDSEAPEAHLPDADPSEVGWHTHEFPREGSIWEHFKGNQYQIIGSAMSWFGDDPLPFVVYRGLYGDSPVWARPLSEWMEEVKKPDYEGMRFTPLGVGDYVNPLE
ncbi:DUF1653 domain-containing protein [Deltaproteobacteria bacterium]|nr:DUF1653 domain-containing protein [Deltaproteobacteria bacterium]